jgi:hypothetical protein
MTEQEFFNDLKSTTDRKIQVEKLTTYILDKNKKNSSGKTFSTKNIIDEYRLLRERDDSLPEIPDNTVTVYLNQLSNSPDSKINCPGRKKGYYLDAILEKIDAIIEKKDLEIPETKNKGNILEKNLYPFFEQWLFEVENERVADISNYRGQGKWANPDLLGLKIDYFFQVPQIEITTIEAKILIDGWEQWIFEYVAHTVFANRSYFSFIHSEEHLNKIPQELRHYAEKFKVGILIMAVSPNDYLKIKNKEAFTLTDENHRIIEYAPAPYNTPHLKYQKRFFESLEIKDQKDLLNFGKSLEK